MKTAVLSVADILQVKPIDGGDTMAMRFTAPGGHEVILLVPRQATLILHAQLAEILSETACLNATGAETLA